MEESQKGCHNRLKGFTQIGRLIYFPCGGQPYEGVLKHPKSNRINHDVVGGAPKVKVHDVVRRILFRMVFKFRDIEGSLVGIGG